MRIKAAAISRMARKRMARTVGAWLLWGPPCSQNSPLYPTAHKQPTPLTSVTQVPWPWQRWAAHNSESGTTESVRPLTFGEEETSGVKFSRNLHPKAELVFGPEARFSVGTGQPLPGTHTHFTLFQTHSPAHLTGLDSPRVRRRSCCWRCTCCHQSRTPLQRGSGAAGSMRFCW